MRGEPQGQDPIRCLHLYRTGVAQSWGDENLGAMARVLEQWHCKESRLPRKKQKSSATHGYSHWRQFFYRKSGIILFPYPHWQTAMSGPDITPNS